MKKRYKLKKKYRLFIHLIIGTVYLALFLLDWFHVLMCGASFTWFGIFTNMLYFIVVYYAYKKAVNYL